MKVLRRLCIHSLTLTLNWKRESRLGRNEHGRWHNSRIWILHRRWGVPSAALRLLMLLMLLMLLLLYILRGWLVLLVWDLVLMLIIITVLLLILYESTALPTTLFFGSCVSLGLRLDPYRCCILNLCVEMSREHSQLSSKRWMYRRPVRLKTRYHVHRHCSR